MYRLEVKYGRKWKMGIHTYETIEQANERKQVMESVGFQAYEGEWWHFYDVSTEPVPYSDYAV